MAENRPPRFVSRQLFSGAKPARASIPKAGLAGGATGSGALARSFGGGDGGQARSFGGLTDPVVSGNFERAPLFTNIFGSFGGDLTKRGQEQQRISQQVQQIGAKVKGMVDQGATTQEAYRSLPQEDWMTLMGHPEALLSLDNLMQHMGIGQPTGANVGLSKAGDQVLKQDTQGNLRYEDIPGARPVPEKTTLVKTDQGYMNRSAAGNLTPALGPNGEQVNPPGKATTPNGFTDSDIGAGPQAPDKRPDGKPALSWDPQSRQFVAAVPSTMDALDTIKQLAPQVAGLGKSLVAIAAGNYLGTNPAGQQMSQAFKVVNAASSMLSGRGYKAPMQNWEALAGTPAQAPSAVTAYATGMQKMVRSIGQQDVDLATQHAGERVPLPQAQQLMGAGIVPNGYAKREYLDQLPPGEGALWKARNKIPLENTDKAQLLTDAAQGKFGNPKDPDNADPDLKLVRNLHQTELAQRAAQKQQATASSAAQATQPRPSVSAPTGNGPTSPGVQPAPGTEPGAQQPQQPGQQQNGQAPQPGGPQNQQQLGQQGQGNEPGQGVPPAAAGAVLPPAQPLMPQQATPGTPVQGMPATNGTTPQPPPNPLPGVSQTLTPQGGMPNPGTQARVPSTTPLTSETMKLLQQGGLDTSVIAQPGDSTGASAPIPQE